MTTKFELSFIGHSCIIPELIITSESPDTSDDLFFDFESFRCFRFLNFSKVFEKFYFQNLDKKIYDRNVHFLLIQNLRAG